MLRKLATLACLALTLCGTAQATIINAGQFVAPTVLDLNDAPGGPINGFYAAQGITFVNFSTAFYQTSPAPASRTALKFFPSATLTNGELLFSSTITRLGFDATTNPEDDTTIFAFLGAALVGSHFFDTIGDGSGGSFLGIEFLGGFDRVVIQTSTVVNGAIAIDNLRFENLGRITDVPEPASLALMGIALLGFGTARRRQRSSH